MLGFLLSVFGIGILALGCSSNTSEESGDDGVSTGGSPAFYVSSGGTSSGSLTGGRTVATSELLAQIENAACSQWNSELEVAPSLLDFVVDTSGSMSDLAPNSQSSRWEVTRDALGAAIADFLPDETAVGVLFYPNEATIPNRLDSELNSGPLPVETCVNVSAMVNVAPIGAAGSAQRATLAQSLAKVQPAGGTPTDDAYAYAVKYGSIPAVDAYPGYLPYMVLITDGQPTILRGCKGTGDPTHPVDWHPIVDNIAAAASSSNFIRTFVVGSPGSDAQSSTGDDGRPWLSMAARTGLTPRSEGCSDDGPEYCHFDLSQSTDFAADLAQGLTEIMRAIPCSFNMPSAPAGCTVEPGTLNVIYKQKVTDNQAAQTWIIGQSEPSCGDDGKNEGWYIDSHTSKIVLCPTTCQNVQNDARARLEVLSGCQTIVPPPQ